MEFERNVVAGSHKEIQIKHILINNIFRKKLEWSIFSVALGGRR